VENYLWIAVEKSGSQSKPLQKIATKRWQTIKSLSFTSFLKNSQNEERKEIAVLFAAQ
jgi:hypothetical protein